MVNRDRLLNEFLELIKITSPTQAEREIGDILKRKLKTLKLKVIEDRTGEVIGASAVI